MSDSRPGYQAGSWKSQSEKRRDVWEQGERPILDFCTDFLLTRKRGQSQRMGCQEAIIHGHTDFFSWVSGVTIRLSSSKKFFFPAGLVLSLTPSVSSNAIAQLTLNDQFPRHLCLPLSPSSLCFCLKLKSFFSGRLLKEHLRMLPQIKANLCVFSWRMSHFSSLKF